MQKLKTQASTSLSRPWKKMKASTSLSQPWKKMKASTSLSQPAFRIPECSAAESKGPLPKYAPIFFCRKVSAMKGKY